MRRHACCVAGMLGLIAAAAAVGPSWAQGLHPGSPRQLAAGTTTTTSPVETVVIGTTASWASAGWTYLRDTLPATAYHGNSYNGAVGADIQATDRLILGAALSGEDTELVTTFNSGHLNTTGYGFNPYAVYTLTNNFYVDGLLGFSWLGNDLDRANGRVLANYDSFRWLANINLNGRFTDGPWQYLPVIGWLYVHQNDESYTERGSGGGSVPSQTAIVSQGRLGGKIGYTIGHWTPYVGARWEHNFIQPGITIAAGVPGGSPSTSNDDAYIQVGVNATFSSAWSGGLEFSTMQKSDQQTYGLLGNIRFTF
jgi:outer membrane autotransporter protein